MNSEFSKVFMHILLAREFIFSSDSQRPFLRKMTNPASSSFSMRFSSLPADDFANFSAFQHKL